ncbi:MAG TPA: twin-arginine translocation signal domain-containing protein [Thermoanaerobaculia bacterium]|nr:twin-arginine translocation signal domain-containing protein [Thermoanaerobaculia bacterium]
MQTRRDFLMTSAAACMLVGAPLSSPGRAAEGAGEDTGAPFFLRGDPYTAHADECGLGGRSFDSAREHALRFRTPDEFRDRLVLGLEV